MVRMMSSILLCEVILGNCSPYHMQSPENVCSLEEGHIKSMYLPINMAYVIV